MMNESNEFSPAHMKMLINAENQIRESYKGGVFPALQPGGTFDISSLYPAALRQLDIPTLIETLRASAATLERQINSINPHASQVICDVLADLRTVCSGPSAPAPAVDDLPDIIHNWLVNTFDPYDDARVQAENLADTIEHLTADRVEVAAPDADITTDEAVRILNEAARAIFCIKCGFGHDGDCTPHA